MSASQRLITRLTNGLPLNLRFVDYLIQDQLKDENQNKVDEPAKRMLSDLIKEARTTLNIPDNEKYTLQDIGKFSLNKVSNSQQQKDLRLIIENDIKDLKYDNALYELELQSNRSKDVYLTFEKELFEIYLYKLDFRRALVYAESIKDPESIFITSFAVGNFEKAKSLFQNILQIIRAEKAKFITVYELLQMQFIVLLILDTPLEFITFYEGNNNIVSKFDYELFSDLVRSLKEHKYIDAFNILKNIKFQLNFSCFSAHIAQDITARIKYNIFTSILQSYGRVSIENLHEITNFKPEEIISFTRTAIRTGKVFGKLDLANGEFRNQNENPQFYNRKMCDRLKICVHKINIAHLNQFPKSNNEDSFE